MWKRLWKMLILLLEAISVSFFGSVPLDLGLLNDSQDNYRPLGRSEIVL
jgi:hypothetical protein